MSSEYVDISLFGLDIPPLPKLDGMLDYTKWARLMRLHFKSKNLWRIVEGTEPKPEPVRSTAKDGTTTDNSSGAKDWERRNSIAMVMLTMAITTAHISFIMSTDSVKEAWDTLERIYKPKGLGDSQVLFSRLFRTKYKNGDNLAEHFMKLVDAAESIAAIDEPVSDSILVFGILASLPQSWDVVVNFAVPLDTKSKPSPKAVISRILAERQPRKTAKNQDLELSLTLRETRQSAEA
ncbi:uncharacterized protein JCM15063_004270 [Sporobolomyces koalae]|uniref:uncharacterized protein n=1 Tax=Sporobolomyces koalae TaxID=500713 RepID=UPI0031730CFE